MHSMTFKIMIRQFHGPCKCCIAHHTFVWFFCWSKMQLEMSTATLTQCKMLATFTACVRFFAGLEMNTEEIRIEILFGTFFFFFLVLRTSKITYVSAHVPLQFFQACILHFANVAFHFEIVVMILEMRLQRCRLCKRFATYIAQIVLLL